MAGATNGIMGDDNFGVQLPQTQLPEQDLSRERSMARFSKTKEFKILKEAMESRMKFWDTYAPGSDMNPVMYRDLSNEERGWRGLVAAVLKDEFKSIIGAYEQATEVVNESNKKENV